MALVKVYDLEEKQKQNPKIQSSVSASYNIFESNGKKIFQIDTFGNQDRQFPNKVSQSIQFEEETLLHILSLVENFNQKNTIVNHNIARIKFHTGIKAKFLRNRIFFGAPGTGKSYKLNQDLYRLIGEDNEFNYERITFHPDYTYAHFVGTYKPVPIKTDENKEVITYKYVPGPFMRVYTKALKNSKTDNIQPFVLIIEEINRSNVAAVFGDIFQLLDRDENNVSEYPIQASEDIKQYLSEQLGGKPEEYDKIRIPDNMFIWATMNSADQGVFPMDTAFKRRWDFTYFGIDDNDDLIKDKYVMLCNNKNQKINWNSLRKAINKFLANEKINEDKQIGPYFISKDIIMPKIGNEIDHDNFIRVFEDKVIMYLYEDAARQKRTKLFDGCSPNNIRFSDICKEFEKKGIAIFNQYIQEEIEEVKPNN
ncbi:MAG: AAA family ATPase [Desulfovibrio sp.]|nr:AAA family ATPase [Desulfovibrio sp.]